MQIGIAGSDRMGGDMAGRFAMPCKGCGSYAIDARDGKL